MSITFAMTGRVTDCVQLTYRTPSDSVRDLLPGGLELVTRGPWAFWNVMCCRVEKLRPVGVPAFCGLTYRHVAYRLMVQAMNDRAEVVRGLYFTRSDANAKAVALLGNRFSDFRLHSATIKQHADDCGVRYAVSGTDYAQGELELEVAHAPAALAKGSCFPTLEDARRFCRYAPNALTTQDCAGKRVLRLTTVQRDERAWCETPVTVRQIRHSYFDSIGQAGHTHLEWACRLGPMDYRWQVGETMGLLQQSQVAAVAARVAG